MADTSVDRIQSLQQSIPEWIHSGLRLVLVALVAKPALSKFVTHENSVSFFDAVGIPFPQLMVIIAGIIEVGVVFLLLAGVGERLAAVSLIPVMLVAILYVGPDWKNLSVLFGALTLLALKTDMDAVWQPANRLLG
ncbi:DoxX family protein (plasmid) [Haloterrigena turkmenica DSM 5511]|uniref:DoxX family protein n=1 Tax=Haloterrigena turkmenica (strain ATCC 51198 / DSM 5511 / JCM 9101 / NCIMB 13204 / VKM B-1734 / 4k) TaxID=543526 RepID=D2S1V8_HALTV|nr:DoxX family protein [Haloterrigena turkmenica]ADB63355.1 DoxX family protein [Haloterrigena turkmenica DSM 5511]